MTANIVDDEKDKRIRGNEAFHEHDTMAVFNKKPGMRYRWLRSTDKRIAQAEMQGWQLVERAKGAERSILTPEAGMQRKGTDVDNLIHNNDMILAMMPLDVYEKKFIIPKRERNQQMMGVTKAPLPSSQGLSFSEAPGSGGYQSSMTTEEFEKIGGKK